MNTRSRVGALVGAAGLTLALVSVAMAAPPTYSINVSVTANPTAVPSGGAAVLFSVIVDNTGTGFFGQVNITTNQGGCTLGSVSGDTDADGNLDDTETWTRTCTVTGVAPSTVFSASVNACHNNSGACNQTSHDATGSAQTTVGLDTSSQPPSQAPSSPPSQAPSNPPSQAPSNPPSNPPSQAPSQAPSDAPSSAPSADPGTFDPGQSVGDAQETVPATDMVQGGSGGSTMSPGATLFVIGIGLLFSSAIILTPVGATRRR